MYYTYLSMNDGFIVFLELVELVLNLPILGELNFSESVCK